MTNDVRAQGVHFVGTIPLSDAEEVFRTVTRYVGDRIDRLPDGETGSRSHWVWIQVPLLHQHPDLEITTVDVPRIGKLELVGFRDGVNPDQLDLGNIGYADFAIESYATFARLKAEGVIAPQVRFQVNLPTPAAICSISTLPDASAQIEAAYTRAMRREIGRILDAIPHDELAIQWDTCLELLWVEGWGDVPTWFEGDIWSAVATRMAALSALVPADVQLGFHLCYGDFQHRRQVDLDDAGTLVDLAHLLVDNVDRRIDFLQLPVRGDIDPAGYLAPLANLRLAKETALYLGLITDQGGLDGARERVRAAREHVAEFGVATECGMGRREPEAILPLLEIHRDTSAPRVS
ncbi:hypothetical protein EV191_101592 [Tamaricihabitans halophyticus]|uniref:5-methyltetrahydropteroyltriglutamate--homocysteine methyltransferase n=1 Tax=Tamaricihabitans halophyticus TaxID=1262583 RepID=A0A4R2R3P0_9PSEU|nr:hypothetical protein [Tamaricihabitans halophyticus]TCP56647.1 hypothetical protein EV191_101592 [Tamaricihabitans halophyticus]